MGAFRRSNGCWRRYPWIGILSCLLFHQGISAPQGSSSAAAFGDPSYGLRVHRVSRQSSTEASSVLTVEWEGIHAGVDDKVISGFRIEYRQEFDTAWLQKGELVPYQGADYQYRVRIKDLPGGRVYFVRISIVDHNGEVLVRTPPIKAHSEDGSIKLVCGAGDIGQPINVKVESTGDGTVDLVWQKPECGTIAKYEVEITGQDAWSQYELRRETTQSTRAMIRNLLPGTRYTFKVRAMDRSDKYGGYSSAMDAKTGGNAPRVSNDIECLYRSDSSLRVEWQPYQGPGLTHYEVTITMLTSGQSTKTLFTARVPKDETQYVFSQLRPGATYAIGVVAYDTQGNPVQVYNIREETAPAGGRPWNASPTVNQQHGSLDISFPMPTGYHGVSGFIVEYRKPDETSWHSQGGVIPYRAGQQSYRTRVDNLDARSQYVTRVLVINSRGEVIATTRDAQAAGGGHPGAGGFSANSCAGLAGTPSDIRVRSVFPSNITFEWRSPSCDEQGTIEGYEYKFWNIDRDPREPLSTEFIRENIVFKAGLEADSRYTVRVRTRSRAGTSPWSKMVQGQTISRGTDTPIDQLSAPANPHNVRVLMALPNQYLAWQAPVSRVGQGAIEQFRVRYIKARETHTNNWITINRPTDEFQCPAENSHRGEYCFDLAKLVPGTQYNSKVAAQFQNGDWSAEGNLHFLLVEATHRIPSAPVRLRVSILSPTKAELTWASPLTRDIPVDKYKITVTTLSSRFEGANIGDSIQSEVDGNTYSKILEKLYPSSQYNVTVEAGYFGNYGPPAWEIFSTPKKEIPPTIRTPNVDERSGVFFVDWEVTGNAQKLCCYQVEIQDINAGQTWRSYGRRISQEGDRKNYNTQVAGLDSNREYYLRINGLLPNGNMETQSPSVRLATQCDAPREPPRPVRMDSSDPRRVTLNWRHPDKSTWGCEQIWYEIDVVVNNRPDRPVQVRPDLNPAAEVEQSIPIKQGADYRLRVRTVNTGGVSPWGDVLNLAGKSKDTPLPPVPLSKTPLIEVSSIDVKGESMLVEWKSIGANSDAYAYELEFATREAGPYNKTSPLVGFRGNNQVYESSIEEGLEFGRSYYIRVVLVNYWRQPLYFSEAGVARLVCFPPQQPPVIVDLTRNATTAHLSFKPPPVKSWRCNRLSYDVEVETIQTDKPAQIIAVDHAHNSVYIPLIPEEQIQVKIRSRNSAGVSRWSDSAATETDGKPTAPLVWDVQFNNRASGSELSWRVPSDNPAAVQAYRIEYFDSSKDTWISEGLIPRHSDDKAVYNTRVKRNTQYRVKAVDSRDQSLYRSAAVSPSSTQLNRTGLGSGRCRSPHQAPQNVRVNSTENSVQLRWQPVFADPSCGFYNVKYETEGSKGYRNVSGSNTAITLSSKPFAPWIFEVRAISSDGVGPWSKPVKTRAYASEIGPVQDFTQSLESRAVNLKWRPPAEDSELVTGYEFTIQQLSRSNCPFAPGPVMTLVSRQSQTQYLLRRLIYPDSTYRLSVAARIEKTGQRTFVNVTTPIDVPSDSPIVSRQPADSTDRSFTITWTAPACESINGELIGYDYELTGVEPNVYADSSSTVQTKAAFGSLVPDSEYNFRIRAKSNAGPGPWSENLAFRTLADTGAGVESTCQGQPSTPTSIRAKALGAEQIYVRWKGIEPSDEACGPIRYELSYQPHQEGGGVDRSSKTILVNATEYILSVDPETRYALKLRGLNSRGPGDWSATKFVETFSGDGKAPGTVLNLHLKPISPSEVEVSWQPPSGISGITGYDVSYRLKRLLACPTAPASDWVTIYSVAELRYLLTGLIPYAEYEIKVAARTTEVGRAESQTITTPQTAPSGPPLHENIEDTQQRTLRFKWGKPDCHQRHGLVTHYQYELMGLDDWAKTDIRTTNTTEQTVTIQNLVPFTKYRFRVKAYTSQGSSPATSHIDVQTLGAAKPQRPQDLTVISEGTDYIRISWLPPYPPYGIVNSYRLRYQQIEKKKKDVPISAWRETEFSALGADRELRCEGIPQQAARPRLCYYIRGLGPHERYRIQAQWGTNSTESIQAKIQSYGEYTDSVYGYTLAEIPNAPLSINKLGKTDTSIKISWVPPNDPKRQITKYRVWATPIPADGVDRKFTVKAPQTQYNIIDLEPATNYNITVQAGTEQGWGPGTYVTERTMPPPVPQLWGIPNITDTGSDYIVVEWDRVLDPRERVKEYFVQYKRYGEPTWIDDDGVTHVPSKNSYRHRITGLIPDKTYWVRIKVSDKDGNHAQPSPHAETRTSCQAPTSPPLELRISAPATDQVRITWRAPGINSWRCSSISFRLSYRNGTNAPEQFIDLPSSRTDHTFLSLPYTEWQVRMRSQNKAGYSDWTSASRITTPQSAPGPVTGVTARPTGPRTVDVSWNPPLNPNGEISGYIVNARLISKGVCPTQPRQPISKTVSGQSVTLDELDPASTYEITVAAKTDEIGQQSRPVVVTTMDDVPTSAPINVQPSSITPKSVVFTWAEPRCEERNGRIVRYEYTLRGVDDWARGRQDRGHTDSPRHEFTDLIPHTKYVFTVRAINSKGQGPVSEDVEVTTRPGAPPAPTDLRSETSFPTAIQISFKPPHPPHGSIDQYRIRHTKTDSVNWVEVRQDARRMECRDGSPDKRMCYRVGDLDAEQQYAIQVSAHTADGEWGDYSDTLNTKTEQADIPVLEQPPRVVGQRADGVDLMWNGLTGDKARGIKGYAVEYNAKGDSGWKKLDSIVPQKPGGVGGPYTATVDDLEPDTDYSIRLRVVHNSGREGLPSPEADTNTQCGVPTQPPGNVRAEGQGFNHVRVTWSVPDHSTWNCEHVNLILKYDNGTKTGYIDFDPKLGSTHHDFTNALPGSTWQISMRTQTAVDDQDPSSSPWSPTVTAQVDAMPDEIYVTAEEKGPDKVEVTWELPEAERDFPYGVDIYYQLRQRGDCPSEQPPPKIMQKVNDKRVVIEDLEPYSKYEIRVQARSPPHMQQLAQPTAKAVTVRTGEKEPTGAPQNIINTQQTESSLTFKWEPPKCDEQNGEITKYEYTIDGIDDWVQNVHTTATSDKKFVNIEKLLPGTTYAFKVRAFTKVGPGPWSEDIEAKTAGSEVGQPRDFQPAGVTSRTITLTWLPPDPPRGKIHSYRLQYRFENDFDQTGKSLRPEDLSCEGIEHHSITADSLCYTIKPLKPASTYINQVQAVSESGTAGKWSDDLYVTTTDTLQGEGGDLDLVDAEPDMLHVKWTAPMLIANDIMHYQVSIQPVAARRDEQPQRFRVARPQQVYQFDGLREATPYNISVAGYGRSDDAGSGERMMWFVSKVFQTPGDEQPFVPWLGPPINLRLVDKDQTSMKIRWDPPELLKPAYEKMITHYVVTYTPRNTFTKEPGERESMEVIAPTTSAQFERLLPATAYNITISAAVKKAVGPPLWGFYSTLDYGEQHILRLRDRTPSSLHVEWEQAWGNAVPEYDLQAVPLYKSVPPQSFRVPGNVRDFKIRGLVPATAYNVTLRPVNSDNFAWGVYATLPPNGYTVANLTICEKTKMSVAFSWNPIDEQSATHYQVRYAKRTDQDWNELPQKSHYEYRCPGNSCGVQTKLCYVVYNMEQNPDQYTIQVRAFVDGHWNVWKSIKRSATDVGPAFSPRPCCIVPPHYQIDHLGAAGSTMTVRIRPMANDSNAENIRYYVIVDERPEKGAYNETTLFDRITAERRGIPYYIGGAFDRSTLPSERDFIIGDGRVYGGYVNYPLVPGKNYRWAQVSVLWFDGKPSVIAYFRDREDGGAYAIGGWPWWWLLLLLALLLLLLLLLCLLFWCCASKYRRRKEQRRVQTNETEKLLVSSDKSLLETPATHYDASSQDTSTYETMDKVDETGVISSGTIIAGDGEGSSNSTGKESDSDSDALRRGKGNFEDGYVRGFRDASKLTAAGARQRLGDEYGNMHGDFHGGYVAGLRDAGMRDMTQSMHDLAGKKSTGGYSAGYMQGFRDGTSGIYGDKITTSLLRRLEEQYPNQDEFRQGYIDGFKDSIKSDGGIGDRLAEISDRLGTLERGKGGKGDEVHTTRIYHVYNQMPGEGGYSAQGQQLASELEQVLDTSSRRSTLRRHYTPGDYLKYGDASEYGSVRKHRRAMSASNLGQRDDYFSTVDKSARQDSRASVGTDTYSRRYNYRTRSDIGATGGSLKRYGSATILDGPRPGPSTPSVSRREALETLQRELDTISRQSGPNRGPPGIRSPPNVTGRSVVRTSTQYSSRYGGATDMTRGYSSDTGYMNDTLRSRGAGGGDSEYYDTYKSQASHQQPEGHGDMTTSHLSPISVQSDQAQQLAAAASSLEQAYNLIGLQGDSQMEASWTDELMRIVQEPMGQTMDRMKRYNTSMSQLAPSPPPPHGAGTEAHTTRQAADGRTVEESYSSSYKQDFSHR